MTKQDIIGLISAIRPYFGKDFNKEMKELTSKHPILQCFSNATSFEGLIALLEEEIKKMERNEKELQEIQNVIDKLNPYYFNDEIEFDATKRDLRKSYPIFDLQKYADCKNVNDLYDTLKAELEKSEERPTRNMKSSRSFHL